MRDVQDWIESKTKITNSGYIGAFNTGAKSTNFITNHGIIGLLNTGLGNTTTLSGGGYCAYAGGQGTILYNINGVTVPQSIYNSAILEAQKQIDGTLAKYYNYGLWHNGGYFLVEDTYANQLYKNLKNEITTLQSKKNVLQAALVPASIVEAFKDAKTEYGIAQPEALCVAAAYILILDAIGFQGPESPQSIKDNLELLKKFTNKYRGVATAKEKLNYVMNSDYKYLMLCPDGRGEFTKQLSILNEQIEKRSFIKYNNSSDNEAYKTAMKYYVNKIYNMNDNFKTSNSVLNKILERIANNVSAVDVKELNEEILGEDEDK